MAVDVLSDVLRVVRLSGSVFFMGEFSAPWALDEPRADELAAYAMPNAECVVLFHILAEGGCYFEAQGLPPVKLESGDVIIFPHADKHRMCSHTGARPAPLDGAVAQAVADGVGQISLGGGGKTSRFICGYLNCDQRFNPLLGALPNILVVRARDEYSSVEAVDRNGVRPAQVPQGSSTWLSTTLKFTVHEARSGRPGNGAMLGRLTELMFVEILRQYMQQLPADNTGWLAGLNDPCVGKALRLMHAEPARNWTVDELAREAAVSRSVLAQRFTDLIGEPPMKYLTTWRIQLAKQMLREGRSIQEVATRVGYDSEAAFNRAFKRAAGIPPAAWRKGVAAKPTSPAEPAAAPAASDQTAAPATLHKPTQTSP
jgi:AraC-like DNA-binding protein